MTDIYSKDILHTASSQQLCPCHFKKVKVSIKKHWDIKSKVVGLYCVHVSSAMFVIVYVPRRNQGPQSWWTCNEPVQQIQPSPFILCLSSCFSLVLLFGLFFLLYCLCVVVFQICVTAVVYQCISILLLVMFCGVFVDRRTSNCCFGKKRMGIQINKQINKHVNKPINPVSGVNTTPCSKNTNQRGFALSQGIQRKENHLKRSNHKRMTAWSSYLPA